MGSGIVCFVQVGGGISFFSYSSLLSKMSRDVEVAADTVYDWHTMLHLNLI